MTENGLRILVVDDERAIRRFLKASLQAHGHLVIEASNGTEALAAAAEQHPDLIVLDLGLPDLDGIEITRRLRDWTHIPIIILSVRDQESEKIAALDAGADDYLTKPFGIGELMARLRVAMRHITTTHDEPVYQFEALQIDLAHRRVTLNGQEVALTPTEYDLLRLLAKNAGRVLTHHYLLREVWGSGYQTETHLLRVNVSNLRHKIEVDPDQPRLVLTEPGVGYRFRANEQ
ncbi:MAG TPA: response regulator [Anaerolineales bacterium]|nr:response regulator [Anaerolineales bacterium]